MIQYMHGSCYARRLLLTTYLIAAAVTNCVAAADTSDASRIVTCQLEGWTSACQDNPKFTTATGAACAAHEGIKCEMLPFFGFSIQDVEDIISHCPCACATECNKSSSSKAIISPTVMPSQTPTKIASMPYPTSSPSRYIGLDSLAAFIESHGYTSNKATENSAGGTTNTKDKSLSAGWRIGIFVGLALVTIAVVGALMIKKRRDNQDEENSRSSGSTDVEEGERNRASVWSAPSEGSRHTSTVFDASTAVRDNRTRDTNSLASKDQDAINAMLQEYGSKTIKQSNHIVLDRIPESVKNTPSSKKSIENKKHIPQSCHIVVDNVPESRKEAKECQAFIQNQKCKLHASNGKKKKMSRQTGMSVSSKIRSGKFTPSL